MFQQDIFQGPGTGTFTTHTFEILIMLAVAFLLGIWLGWVLWSRYRELAEKLRVDNESLGATATALRTENDALKTRLAGAESERAAQAAQIQNLTWEAENQRSQIAVLESDMAKLHERNRQLESELGMSYAADAASTAAVPLEIATPFPSEPAEDLPDLEAAIAGAVDEAFDAHGLDMPALEDAVADAVQAALSETPEKQVVEEASTVVAAPAPETLAPQEEKVAEPVVTVFAAGPRDDLKIVEGIGPKIEEILFKAGITTYGQLAATSVQQLKDILAEAGSRFAMHDPGTWSAQSLLAANGEWENLKAYQDFLNAGKRPDIK